MNTDGLTNILRTIARIRDVLDAIENEGMESPDFWYARDRFHAIQDIAKLASDGKFTEAWQDGWGGTEKIIDKWIEMPRPKPAADSARR